MGNRTEYLLATMKTPQYDIGAFSNASNQLINALNAGANQIGEYNKQQSQAYANQYVNDLLGKTNEANYTNNIAKLRGMGAYTSPEMQKQIEGIASDIKDQRSYNLQKEQARLAQAKFDYDKAQQDKKEAEEFNAKVGALGAAQADILGSEYANGKISHPLLAKGITGIDTGSVAAAKEGLLNLSPEDRATAMQELNNRINEAYGEYANYNRQRDVAINQATALQSLLAQKELSDKQLAQSAYQYNHPHYAPDRSIVYGKDGSAYYVVNGVPTPMTIGGKPIQKAPEKIDSYTVKEYDPLTHQVIGEHREYIGADGLPHVLKPAKGAANKEAEAEAYIGNSLNKK